jgi:hypothetical protein
VKRAGVGGLRVARVLGNHNKGTSAMVKRMLLLCIIVGGSVTAAGAVDMNALAPCKPAAARYCDRSGWSMADLLRCAATLAANSDKVGGGCREVLRRYGQLS